jgi:branched-subunit amino acid transport protein
MNDQNRYEDVPQKENKFVKGLKAFGSYLKFVFVDFFNSFKYNNMKLAAILFAMPGILLGFFMFAHVPTIRHVTVSYQSVNLDSKMDISVTEDTGNDYLLTIAKYNVNGKDYTNIEMQLNKPEITVANQDDYAVDSEAVPGKENQIATPTMTITQISTEDAEGNPVYNENEYSVVVNLPEEDQSHIAKYMVFIFVTAKNNKEYQVGNYYSFTNPETVLTISNLGKSPYKYKAVVKALAQGGEGTYYSSNLSEPVDITVNANGSAYAESNYDFIQYQGDYKVKSVDGGLNDDISKFKMTVNANGTAVYKDEAKNETKEGQLMASGTSLVSNDLFTIHILPFDFAGISIFFLTLLGFLNVFLSLELSKKKNFGTVIKCCVTTALICGLSALYVYSIFATQAAIDRKENALVLASTTSVLDSNAYVSIVAVLASCVFSLAGLVLAFINYDRTYEKVDR